MTMVSQNEQTNKAKLSEALGASRSLFIWLGIFSFFINLLMLTGPIYMLQIYDTVLSSQSMPTLLALTGLIAALFMGLGFLEIVRGGLLQRVAQRFQRQIARPMFDAAIALGLKDQGKLADQPMHDVRAIRQFLTSPALNAAYDIPWSPAFLALIYFFHPTLGWLAIGGSLTLIIIAIINEIMTRRMFQSSNRATTNAQETVSAIVRNVEVVEALGMREAMHERWCRSTHQADLATLSAGDRNAMFTSTTKIFRLFLQSAMLGMGALLVIQQEITAGVMIAASIILGRALAPLEQGIGQWRSIVGVRDAWLRLYKMLSATPILKESMPLPPITGKLDIENLFVAPPGLSKPVSSNISFSIKQGEALGIIGSSGAGKSTLARALVGLWQPMQGTVRLDGSEIHQRNRSELGPQIGYLPQGMELFAGTVKENISRFESEPDVDEVLRAAKEAGCHNLILKLPEGYDTQIGPMGGFLSAGQRQRIALARALYRLPKYIVLDEPNANLDGEGDVALGEAILNARDRGATVIVISHRPSAIQYVDKLLVMNNGSITAFGPRDDVLQSTLRASPVSNNKPASKLDTIVSNKTAVR